MEKPSEGQPKKWMENPFLAGLTVPIGIIVLGALIVFGVSKMLSSERSHRDLIREMDSKTFGNRWVAAYELSKLFARKEIPQSDRSWVIEELSRLYEESPDARSRHFLIAALGTLKTTEILPVHYLALKDPDPEVLFRAIANLGNFPQEMAPQVDWNLLIPFVDSPDAGVQQAAILSLGNHRVKQAETKLAGALDSEIPAIKYAAATALINFRNPKAVETLQEALSLEASPDAQGFSLQKTKLLKLNILNALGRNKWRALNSFLVERQSKETDLKLTTKIRETLNILKN